MHSIIQHDGKTNLSEHVGVFIGKGKPESSFIDDRVYTCSHELSSKDDYVIILKSIDDKECELRLDFEDIVK